MPSTFRQATDTARIRIGAPLEHPRYLRHSIGPLRHLGEAHAFPHGFCISSSVSAEAKKPKNFTLEGLDKVFAIDTSSLMPGLIFSARHPFGDKLCGALKGELALLSCTWPAGLCCGIAVEAPSAATSSRQDRTNIIDH